MFEYQLIRYDEKATVLLKGDMDIEITEIMEGELMSALQNFKEIELNFEDVSFVDSTGIGLLMNTVRHFTELEVKITITHLREEVYQVFDLLQIPEILGWDVFPIIPILNE